MAETAVEDVNYLIATIAEFYNGSVQYTELQEMPLPEVHELHKNAIKIQEETKRQNKIGR